MAFSETAISDPSLLTYVPAIAAASDADLKRVSRAIDVLHIASMAKFDELRPLFESVTTDGMRRNSGGVHDLDGAELMMFTPAQQLTVSNVITPCENDKYDN